ncbi:MAG: family 20 glycosylhydrolase [Bacteroidota bacterium]
MSCLNKVQLLKMNRVIALFLLIVNCNALGQIKTEGLKDNTFPTFYQQRSSLFRLLPQTTDDIIFLGNSITNGNEWGELFSDAHVKNRGISGDITTGVLNRLDEVIARKPAKIFLLIGINDFAAGNAPDTVVGHIFQIAKRVNEQTPGTQLYVQSLLPVNDAFNKFPTHVNKLEKVKQTNLMLEAGAKAGHYTYIDLSPSFCNKDGKLDTLYTNDGLHEKGPGYMLWKHLIYPYVYDLQNKPSLMPKPQSLTWTDDRFPIYQCRFIWVKNALFKKEAIRLQQMLLQMGWQTAITDHEIAGAVPLIVLEQKQMVTSRVNDEAYQLTVNNHTVSIQAGTPHGCYNALQTLSQLLRDGSFIPGVIITDHPAFAWRGYMVDVGRNYLSIPLLRQQIEVMAKYKLNIFHLHLTEDIAWRLQIKKYPQLTEPANMQRNKGAYYSVDELKDLIAFCKERYITLIPEVDMPGHSAAFKRAFNCDMQSDSGMVIVKNILKEICETYDIGFLHLGGDEVKITNKNFLPTMIKYVQAMGKQTIAWSPGGNLDKSTIRQLWMSDGATDPGLKYLDSRNLYINHMDPLESVISIFNRKIGENEKGMNNTLGSILCLWPDRNVIAQEDVLTMNPVYPAMLTFAEKTWSGGGIMGWHTDIAAGNKDFTDFENRLIDQQKQYFSNLPFPYVSQSAMKWRLYGPYPNYGNLTAKFEPEKKGFKPDDNKYQSITGATIILRHFWYPKVESVLTKPRDSTTYYAASRIWSNSDTTALMWIGFYNISRSVPTSTPHLGTWDDRNSSIWINNQIINPPVWAHAGQVGDIEKPLVDESYEYRAPVKVKLHSGWNQLLVKTPVSSFNSAKTQNPVKWMFTAIFVKPLGQNYITDDQLRFFDN